MKVNGREKDERRRIVEEMKRKKGGLVLRAFPLAWMFFHISNLARILIMRCI